MTSAAFADAPAALPPGLHQDVELTLHSPLAANAAMAERFLSPRNLRRLTQTLERTGKGLAERPVDLGKERFLVYVPKTAPPRGYGLLVFVPPWDRARLPRGWAEVLDKAGVIFVSASGSGNEENILGRRYPLALEAAYNMVAQFKADPERIYLSGFSGGSRTALRIALDYPDVFKGALLDAGSDPIGDDISPMPSKALAEVFQTSSAVVMTSGVDDEVNVGKDRDTAASLHSWCVGRFSYFTVPHLAHEPLAAEPFERALKELERLRAQPPQDLAHCRESVQHRLDQRFQAADARKSQPEAWAKALDGIDRAFGGLAAPRSLEDQDPRR